MLPPPLLGLPGMRSCSKIVNAAILGRTSSHLYPGSSTGPLLRIPFLNASSSSSSNNVRNHHHHQSSSCSCCSSSKPSATRDSRVPLVTPTMGGDSSPLNGLSFTSSRNNAGIITRHISMYGPVFAETEKEAAANSEEAETEEGNEEEQNKKSAQAPKNTGPIARHLDKDRTKVIPVETSIRYLKSAAYKETYGDQPVWVPYRRNFPGQWAPKKTRRRCIRNDQLATGNPCPLCRDIYLVVDYRNTELLKQFISPYTGEVLAWSQTNVCRSKQEALLIEIERARDYGTLTFDMPFKEYDDKEYEKIYRTY